MRTINNSTAELILKGKKGDDRAKEELLELLQPYVRSLVNRYLHSSPTKNIRDDLISAGNKGLLMAYDNFDISKGSKFTTYAWHYVRKAIDIERWVISGLDKNLAPYASAVWKAKSDLVKLGESNPSVKDIAELSKVATSKVDSIECFLAAKHIHTEITDEDESTNDWVCEEVELNGEQKFDSSVERSWEFQEEDIGFIFPSIATYLLEKWKKDNPKRHQQFMDSISSPNKCLRRRLVYANGARGKLDVFALKKLCEHSSGLDVYDRRKIWKEHS